MNDEGWSRDEFIQNFLDGLFSLPSCSWCMDHSRPLYGKRLRLCSSCRSIRATIRKLEKRVGRHRRPLRSGFDHDRYELDVAKSMKMLARCDGIEFGAINTKDITGLDLEHIFNEVSRMVVRKDLFGNDALMFDQCYTLPQLRLLYYQMSRLARIRRRKYRKFRAAQELQT